MKRKGEQGRERGRRRDYRKRNGRIMKEYDKNQGRYERKKGEE